MSATYVLWNCIELWTRNPAEYSPHRDVLALTLLKASGSLVWAAADVLNVRFAELPEMQGLGDSAFTLGLFFASVGAACFVGKSFSASRDIAHSTIANGTPFLLFSFLQVPLSSTGSHLQSELHNPESQDYPLSCLLPGHSSRLHMQAAQSAAQLRHVLPVPGRRISRHSSLRYVLGAGPLSSYHAWALSSSSGGTSCCIQPCPVCRERVHNVQQHHGAQLWLGGDVGLLHPADPAQGARRPPGPHAGLGDGVSDGEEAPPSSVKPLSHREVPSQPATAMKPNAPDRWRSVPAGCLEAWRWTTWA